MKAHSTHTASPRSRRVARSAFCRWGLGVSVALFAWIGVDAPAHAQEPTRIEALENEHRLEYQSAEDVYEGALAARAAGESRFARVTQDIEDARRAGDDERRNEALAEAQILTSELLGLDARVAETAADLETARERYLETLDIRLDFVAQRIEFATSAADSAQLGATYRDLRARFADVEQNSRGDVALVAVVMPELRATPRDGPRELHAKADLLERRAQQADSVIAYIASELVDLERRALRDRGMQALQRGIDRFDDTRVPVRPSSQTDGGGQPGAIAETPEERVASLRQLQAVFEQRSLEARRRAREFRALAGPSGEEFAE